MKKNKIALHNKQEKNFIIRYKKQILIVLLVFAGILYLLSINNYFWVDGDNVKYVLLGKCILSGDYNDIWEVTSPPHLTYWPGFPLMLSIPLLVTNNIAVLKLVPIICLLIGFIFLYKYLELKFDAKWAITGLFLCVINPAMFTFAHTLLTQTPFFMTLIISIYYTEKFIIQKKQIKSKEFFWLLFSTILAKYIRAEGDFLALFIFIYLLLKKRIKPAFIFLGVFITFNAVWIIRNKIAYLNATDLQKKYFLKNFGRTANILKKGPYQEGTVTLSDLIVRFFEGIKIYFLLIIPANVLGMNFMINKPFWGFTLGILILYGFFASFDIKKFKEISIKSLMNKTTPMHMYFVFGILLVLLAFGRTEKYLFPIIPFLIIFIFMSIDKILKIIRLKTKVVFAILLIIFAYFSITKTFNLLNKERSNRYYNPVFANYLELAKWFGKQFPPEVKVITRKSEYFYWYSKRKGTGILVNKSPEENLEYINELDIDYIIYTETGFDWGTNPTLIKLLRKYPQFFEVQYSGYVPYTNNRYKYAILKVKKEEVSKFFKKTG